MATGVMGILLGRLWREFKLNFIWEESSIRLSSLSRILLVLTAEPFQNMLVHSSLFRVCIEHIPYSLTVNNLGVLL